MLRGSNSSTRTAEHAAPLHMCFSNILRHQLSSLLKGPATSNFERTRRSLRSFRNICSLGQPLALRYLGQTSGRMLQGTKPAGYINPTGPAGRVDSSFIHCLDPSTYCGGLNKLNIISGIFEIAATIAVLRIWSHNVGNY